MSTEQAEVSKEGVYLTLSAPTELKDADFLQDSELIISNRASRSGPSVVRTTLAAIAVAAVLTISNAGRSAYAGPVCAPDRNNVTRSNDPKVTELVSRIAQVEHAMALHPDYPKADPKALIAAREWAAKFPATVSTWENPSVAANAFGEIVFEWWSGSKTLAIYFDDSSHVKFVKSPGIDISKMSDGTVKTDKHLGELLGWLLKKTTA